AHATPDLVLKPVGEFSADLDPARVERIAGGDALAAIRAGGTDYFMLARAVPDTDWVLGIAMKREVVLAPLDTLLLGIVAVLALATAAAAGIASMVLSRLLSGLRRIRNALAEIAQGEGDLTARLDIRSEDEIGKVAQ